MGNLITYKDKVIGEVIDGVYYKSIRGSRNILKNQKGQYTSIALNMNEVNDLLLLQAKRIHITDTETKRIYTVPFEIFMREGQRFNIGYGDQQRLAYRRWTQLIPSQPMLAGIEL